MKPGISCMQFDSFSRNTVNQLRSVGIVFRFYYLQGRIAIFHTFPPVLSL